MTTHNRGSNGSHKTASKDTFSLKTPANNQLILLELEKALESLPIKIQEHFLLEQIDRTKRTKENPEWKFPITMKDLTNSIDLKNIKAFANMTGSQQGLQNEQGNFDDKSSSSFLLANQPLLRKIENTLATFPIEIQEKFLTGQSKRIERHVRVAKMPVQRSLTTFSRILLFILMCAFLAIGFHYLPSAKPQADIRSSLEQQQVTYAMDQSSTDLLIKKFEQWSLKETKDPLVIAIVGSATKVESHIQERLTILKEASANEDLEILRVDQMTSRVDLYEHFARDLSSQRAPSLSVVLGIEKLKWDSPLSLHAWGDDGQPLTNPPAENSLIILGVTVEEEITEQCAKFLQKYLLEKWKENGGTYSMITPIVNSRIDYAFCL